VTEPDEPAAATVRAYIGALNRGSADEVAACVSDGFVNEHVSTLGRTLVGREAYRMRLGEFLATFPGLHYEVERMIVEQANVAVCYRMTGAFRRGGADASADRPFVIRGMFRFEVQAGEITHRVDYWDSADFLRQVGEQDGSVDPTKAPAR
jgi:steroid delta-isomerase-like uncharacterized protein